MIDLLNEDSPKPSEPVSRLAQQSLFVASDGVQRRVLKTDPRRGIDLVVNEYGPGTGSNGAPVHHSGYEYGIVLEGGLTVEIAGERYEMRAGDCISYDSNSPHRILNGGKRHVRVLWVNLGR
jgi:mannose-6-phosphate isomerase-like protein (cupin superfamily)